MSVTASTADRVNELILSDITLQKPHTFQSDTLWMKLTETGTRIWLDTGDIDEAAKVWTNEMSALTTNNTLLNHEIQKGIYDDFIVQADEILYGMNVDERIQEIAFMLNARHGLKLVEKFNALVSVELHTDFAHDIEKIVTFGERLHQVAPEHFIIKVPFTAAGLIGARKLKEKNIKVNMTLGFSARQNAIMAAFTNPDFVNVFLGRINAYLIENSLGDGELVGEKTTLASQRVVRKITKNQPIKTKQIAASMRDASQINSLAGVDVFTIPLKVVKQMLKEPNADFLSKSDEDYLVQIDASSDLSSVKIEKLWELSDAEESFIAALSEDQPQSGKEVQQIAHDLNVGDIFPYFSKDDLLTIRSDGKIPKHARWASRIKTGELAMDTLLNASGLATFAQDQQELDERILQIINQ